MRHLNLLLIFIPVSLASNYFNVDAKLTFAATCLAIVPIAVLISDATEQISIYTGSKIGGLLNATMGNIPELFIGLFAVKAGLYKLMLASGGFHYRQPHVCVGHEYFMWRHYLFHANIR